MRPPTMLSSIDGSSSDARRILRPSWRPARTYRGPRWCDSLSRGGSGGVTMRQAGLFGLSEHLERLSKDGDPLEVLEATVDFEDFRPWLVEGLGYGDGSKGGRPPFDPVSMFKALILEAQHNLSDARMEFMIRDRLSWMRFLGFDLGAPTPDASTIRHVRNRLTETGTLKRVMKAFDWQLRKKGYIPPLGDCGQSPVGQRMAGQIVDASLVPAPKQRNTEAEKAAIKDGKSTREIWPDEPNKAAQKDTNARWTLKIGQISLAVLPSLIAAFSASVLRRLGAGAAARRRPRPR
ncbi:MAG: transposase [Pseudomonadota bacterium]